MGLYEQVVIFGVLIILLICALLYTVVIIIIKINKSYDKKERLIRRKAKILEKVVKYGQITWFVVEFENGERIRLRALNGTGLLITAGDVGIISFRGKTIEKIQLK